MRGLICTRALEPLPLVCKKFNWAELYETQYPLWPNVFAVAPYVCAHRDSRSVNPITKLNTLLYLASSHLHWNTLLHHGLLLLPCHPIASPWVMPALFPVCLSHILPQPLQQAPYSVPQKAHRMLPPASQQTPNPHSRPPHAPLPPPPPGPYCRPLRNSWFTSCTLNPPNHSLLLSSATPPYSVLRNDQSMVYLPPLKP